MKLKTTSNNVAPAMNIKLNNRKKTLMTHPIPNLPWSKVAIDLFSIKDKNYLITVDFYSDFWELDELRTSATSETVIKCLKEHFSRHGIPDICLTDNGPQFDSKSFEHFANQGLTNPLA